jgi:hypothetical protein
MDGFHLQQGSSQKRLLRQMAHIHFWQERQNRTVKPQNSEEETQGNAVTTVALQAMEVNNRARERKRWLTERT